MYIRKKVQDVYKQLLALPHDPIPSSVSKYSLDLNGPLKRNFPNGLKNQNEIAKEFMPFLERQREKYKDEGLFVVWMANYNLSPIPLCTIFITDINLMKEICRTKNSEVFEKGITYSILSEMLGDGVIAAKHSEWKHQRRVLDKGFTDAMMDAQYPIVKAKTSDLIARINFLCKDGGRDGVDVDVLVEMQKVTLDILGKVAFGYEFGCLNAKSEDKTEAHQKFQTITDTLTQRIFSPLKFLFKMVPTSENRKYNKAISYLDTLVTSIIQNKRANDAITKPEDLLDILLADNTLSNQLILDNVKSVLFAGQDTTSAALTWAFYLLSKHPEVVEQLRAERESLGDKYSRKDLEDCEFLNAVTLEVLRLYPAAGTVRRTKKAIQVGKYVIPPMVDIFFISYLIQRNGKYYNNPDQFIPERWLQTKAEKVSLQTRFAKISNSENQSFVPFSFGNRNCVGRKLALLELREILLEISHNFTILPAPNREDFQETPYYSVTVAPHNVHVIFRRRTTNL